MTVLHFNDFIKAFDEQTEKIIFVDEQERLSYEHDFLKTYLKSKSKRHDYYDRYIEVFRGLSPRQVKKHLSQSMTLDLDIKLEFLLYAPCSFIVKAEDEQIELIAKQYIDPDENLIEEHLIGATRKDGFEKSYPYLGSIYMRNIVALFGAIDYDQVTIPAPVFDGYKHWLKMGFMLRENAWPNIQKNIAQLIKRTVHSKNRDSLISRFLKSGPRVLNALAIDKGEQATELFKDFQKTNATINPVLCGEEYYFDLKSKRQRSMLKSFCKRRLISPPDYKNERGYSRSIKSKKLMT